MRVGKLMTPMSKVETRAPPSSYFIHPPQHTFLSPVDKDTDLFAFSELPDLTTAVITSAPSTSLIGPVAFLYQ